MPKRNSHKKNARQKLFIYKEFLLGFLAFLSIGVVFFEYFAEPKNQTLRTFNHIDIAIACIFLTDFILSLLFTSNRRLYLRHNWYFIFAAIPLSDSIAEALRGIRILRLLRLLRAGEHLDYSVTVDRR